MRAATRGLVEAADSIAGSQRDLGERTGDLAQQRSRDETTGGRRPPPSSQAGTLPFQATERAQALAREQEALEQRVQELSKAVEEIARAAQAAGINDSAFQQRLREVQQLLQRAVTPELEQRLRELQEALAKLDPDATRQALQRLAEAQQQLKAELERSRELFQRAATEGALASLAADAEDLKRRQAEWNDTDARRPDSAAAARERALEERADSLAHGIEQVGKDLGLPSGSEAPLAAPQQAARQAQSAMQRAAESAGQGDQAGAQRSGETAEQQLAGLPDALRTRRDSLAGAWSGSGCAEAVEQLARMARDQQGLNGAARGLLPMMGPSGQAVLEQLRAIAARQRALAQQLERLQAEGGSGAAGALAQEARELARQLDAGRLDQQTIQRQERLYRRLLDAGRTLSGSEPDESKERSSRPATGDSVHLPALLKPGATGGGPRLRYPTWEELSGLTPEQRRLVLEYFRRLNAPEPR